MRKVTMIILLAIIVISGCSNNSGEQKSIDGHAESVNDGGMGDLREETKGKETLPNFLDNHDENMQLLYTAAAEHQELLEHMPCYCGCGESVGHGHNFNCFINEANEDGTVVWDDHATRCQVCLDIAAESIIEYNEGKSINDIRDSIDTKYGDEGYPKPTETARYQSS